jgi:hypothetical protein
MELSEGTLVAKQEKLARDDRRILPTKYICSYPYGSLTRRKILQHGTDGIASPPKEGVPQIFIANQNPAHSAGYEHANLGSNGDHAKH